jgi:hypothetical protein
VKALAAELENAVAGLPEQIRAASAAARTDRRRKLLTIDRSRNSPIMQLSRFEISPHMDEKAQSACLSERCHETDGYRNLPVFGGRVPVRGKEIPCSVQNRESSNSPLESQCKSTPKPAKSAGIVGDFRHFPVIFPVLRESARPARRVGEAAGRVSHPPTGSQAHPFLRVPDEVLRRRKTRGSACGHGR